MNGPKRLMAATLLSPLCAPVCDHGGGALSGAPVYGGGDSAPVASGSGGPGMRSSPTWR